MTASASPDSKTITYLDVLRNRNFALLWIGQSISLVGDVMFMFSINWLILERTGSALQVGGNLVVTVISNLVFSAVAGVLADRWNRRWLLLGSDLLRGGLVLSLAITLWLTPFSIWYIYITNFLLTSISSFFTPTYQAVIPGVLNKDVLVIGRSLTISTARLLQVLGSALSGLFIAAFSVEWGIVINALSFFISALTIFLTHIPQATSPSRKSLTVSTLFGDILDGWRFIRESMVLASLFLLFTLGDFGAAFTWPVHVVFAEKVLKGGPQLYGYLASVSLLGGFLGAFFVGRYNSWFKRRAGVSYFLANSIWGIFCILFGLTSSIPLALIYRFFIGWSLSMIHVPISALVDVNTPDSHRGRVWASLMMGSNVASTFSVGLSGLIADHWSARFSYVIAGSILLIVALVSFRSPSIRNARVE